MYEHRGCAHHVVVGAGPNSQITAANGNWRIKSTARGYRIENVYSSRALYADRDENWMDGFGAAQILEGTYWNITQNPDGSYRIVNTESQRCLYAHPEGTSQEGLGAEYPETCVSSHECWVFIFSAVVDEP